ncbi:FAD dependent oxidoreductase [Staphylotrichum tortipilum]|uniref:FAD dependent oxidoreductase n=1 Tax=Staphylotrichum tortipilum TaxID=2831512 RepID=A0AAN6RWG8_9PEZI|nr:FAD dependent oxidoreductase [Staphylotrichum longicolle]
MCVETVILGAGIIGVSTAYYLSKHQEPSSIHLVEPSLEMFSSASGYAGGFLAKDWFAPSVSALGALSFEEHRRLAEEHGGRERWGYSPATCISYAASAERRGAQERGDDWLRHGTSRADAAPVGIDALAGKTPSWLRRREGDHVELISDEGSTAQVDPLLLCEFLLQECVKRGVQLHHPARPVSVRTDDEGRLATICIEATNTGSAPTETLELPCTRVIITAGAWTGQVFQALFPKSELTLPIKSLAGHSLVLKSPQWHAGMAGNGCHAVFTTHNEGFCPEMFSRVGGHIYFAGLNSSTLALPDAAAGKAAPHRERLTQLLMAAREIIGSGEGAGDDGVEVVREGLCFRPVTPWGRPIVSKIADRDLGAGVATKPGGGGGVFVAAGHGPWGIVMSLGTGVVLAELVQGRGLSADISGLTFSSGGGEA